MLNQSVSNPSHFCSVLLSNFWSGFPFKKNLPLSLENLNENNYFPNLQMRLDFTNFVITGPTTITTSIGLSLGGQIMSTGSGLAMTQKTTCATDTFSVSNAPSIPVLCGTLTGDHGNIYFIVIVVQGVPFIFCQ